MSELEQMRSALTLAATLAASGDIDDLQKLRELLCSTNGRSVVVSEIDTLREALAAKDAEIARWKAAIEGLTPQGSEYVNDPDACASAIRERCKRPKILIRERDRADAAEARVRELEE